MFLHLKDCLKNSCKNGNKTQKQQSSINILNSIIAIEHQSDKCLKTLEDTLKIKLHDRLIQFHKGKITKTHTASFHYHKEGQRTCQDCLQISENVWQVK